jgi:hypothetical protein
VEMFLFMGAIVGIRNPKVHETVKQTNPHKTFEFLALASLLARKRERVLATRSRDCYMRSIPRGLGAPAR